MKRIQYHRYGGPDVVRLEEFEPPHPRGRQVLVPVSAAASNPMDWMIRSGAVRLLTGWRFLRGLGHDFSGIVEAVGDEVESLAVGDEVSGATLMPGASAEAVVAHERFVAKKPANVSFEDAAARALGVDPVVGFDFDPTPLRARFDLVLDTSGVLPARSARMLLKPGGRIIDIRPPRPRCCATPSLVRTRSTPCPAET